MGRFVVPAQCRRTAGVGGHGTLIHFSLLGSGSSGNALLVMSKRAKILIDSGLSYRQLRLRAKSLKVDIDDLSAVFVTHEHGDHVNGIGVLARNQNVPVFMTSDTQENLPASVGRIPRIETFDAGDPITVDGISLRSFSVSHDAADPVSYVVSADGARLGIATDLGKPSLLVRERLKGSHALILESNYCPAMLRKSSYPAAIRQRINGNRGHLSNQDMNSLLSGLLHSDLQLVIAVHVSQENNSEERARMMALQVLKDHPAELVIAQQETPTPLFTISPQIHDRLDNTRQCAASM